MADLGQFDASNEEIMDGYTPVPNGDYTAIITSSEFKNNKKGNGGVLELLFKIVEGEYKDRELKAWLNIVNPSEMAVKIARSNLAKICLACGVPKPGDSSKLHNIPMTISVKATVNTETGKATNEIRDFKKREVGGIQNNQVGQVKSDPFSSGL